MKIRELTVRCAYRDDGEDVRELLCASFAAFLKWELESADPGREQPAAGAMHGRISREGSACTAR